MLKIILKWCWWNEKRVALRELYISSLVRGDFGHMFYLSKIRYCIIVYCSTEIKLVHIFDPLLIVLSWRSYSFPNDVSIEFMRVTLGKLISSYWWLMKRNWFSLVWWWNLIIFMILHGIILMDLINVLSCRELLKLL